MLLELHVRNLALIERADLEFGEGLTILSGETGAGKSILIDSINLALGAKASAASIRPGADNAYIELIFQVKEPRLSQIREMDIPVEEDGMLIVSRKILPSRSVMKINDETVTAGKLRSLTGLLIDMHGQFEHQSLMYPQAHLAYVDRMTGEETGKTRTAIAEDVREYRLILEEMASGEDASIRAREADILRYEIEEIENAALIPGEEEELLAVFRRMKNASRITEALSGAQKALEGGSDEVGSALREIGDVIRFDPELESIREELSQVESLLDEAGRSVREYVFGLEFDEEAFVRTEERLDVIHRLQGKYGDDVAAINRSAQEKKDRLSYLEHFDENLERLIKRKGKLEEELTELCSKLTAARKEAAGRLREKIVKELTDLNFLGVEFDIVFGDTGRFTPEGRDTAEFMISTNPGQPLRPMKDVASGGELSRIMLALKAVMADRDEIDTLIFDEIDTGISGKTARKVAEKLAVIGRGHQVLCITHLAQIAAMADTHLLIEKSTDGVSTRTDIKPLSPEEEITELARLLSGDEETESVIHAAEELKRSADVIKSKR